MKFEKNDDNKFNIQHDAVCRGRGEWPATDL